MSCLSQLRSSLPDQYSRFRSALAKRYRLERELGRGGMATVYLAHDLKHDRSVALKVLHPELAAALGPERFHREIMLAARLQHPHILSVHDSGEAAGQLWFTMPFVEGESLRDRLNREKQLPVEDAVRIAREAALALEYAHQHGVVHRDVKPENLMLTTDGSTMVADFGIARALSGGEQQLTGTGIAIGTPAYMSPEQASGIHEVDARTDVYALGCVLYEMLAGEPPYTGPTAQAIIARALTETPRPIHPWRAGVPAAVDATIAKAMAVTAADRYASAAEFARALEPVFRSPSPVREGGAGAEAPRPAPFPTWLARRPLFAMLALGVLLGGGVLFAWRRSLGGGDGAGGKWVAVLPFENLGGSEDEYFADGQADAVRGKLSAVPGLQVIAIGSANQYKHSTKSLTEIAHELGAQYLLIGKVRWGKTSDGRSRVQVTTELVQVTSGPPTTRWQAPFDAPYNDIFAVQADIAGRVAQALDVELGDSTRRQLGERSTQNLAAYDAFMKGEEVSQSLAIADPQVIHRAVTYYAQAVTLDSFYAQAWAQLSRAHSLLYGNGVPAPAVAEQALRAAERALALAPNSPEGHLAMGFYHYIEQYDLHSAQAEFEKGLQLAPNNSALLGASGLVERALGHWEAALVHFQQAQKLDPRSVGGESRLTALFLYLRHYPEARLSADRALVLAPTGFSEIENRMEVSLAQGDLTGARSVLAAAAGGVDTSALLAYVATYDDLYWVLDDAQQQLLLHLPPSAFDDDRSAWGIVRAQTYWLRGDQLRARVYADSARIALEEQLRATPDNDQRHVFLGLALAYLGQKAEAIREGERAVSLLPIAKDAIGGPYTQHQLVRIYLLIGEHEKALDLLEPLLRIPYSLSPGWLKIDPNFAPLRGNPRFQRLVDQAN